MYLCGSFSSKRKKGFLTMKLLMAIITIFLQDRALFPKGTATNTEEKKHFYKESIACTVAQVTPTKKRLYHHKRFLHL